MKKQHDQTSSDPTPEPVLKTGGEDSARAYVASELPAPTDAPTIELERVKIVPPTQTPTVRLKDVPKRAGPRAPDQMELPKPKGPVELPDGRPVTKMQRIEIDSDFLIELAREREAHRAVKQGGAPAATEAADTPSATPPIGRTESPWVKEAAPILPAAELPSADAPPSAPASTAAGKRPRNGTLAMGVAIGLTFAAAIIAALRSGSAPPVDATPKASATTNATTMPSTPPSTTAAAAPSATAMPAPAATASASAAPRVEASAPSVRAKSTATAPDPYDDAPAPRAAKTAEPVAAPPLPATTASPSASPRPSSSAWGGHTMEF